MEPYLAEANQKIQDALDHVRKELASIRAGRANPSLIEDLPVYAYDSQMKLIELGSITAPQPSMLMIQLWDASVIRAVEKAIMEANLGINPAVDGTTIRLPFPPLTEERREEYIKMARQKGEAGKVEVRQIRGDQRDQWHKAKEAGEIGEDEFFRREKALQELIDKSVANIDEMVKTKEEDLRQI